MNTQPRNCSMRAAFRAAMLIGWMLVMLPPVLLAWLLRCERPRGRLAQAFYAGAGRIVGLHVTVEGAPATPRPLLIVANHASYLDIFVLGAQLPLSFTPKREVRDWPLIGFLCVLADCVFVERRPAFMEQARAAMAARIARGRVLCLFPEGTTSDGKYLKPFKSGFLSLAEQHALPVQPASIAYTHIGQKPIADGARDRVAWVGDASFFSHFLRVMGLPSVRVTLRWHAPLDRTDFTDRKALTKAAETIIGAGLLADLPMVEEIHAPR